MELRLRLLDSFVASGSDGASYKVCAYDRLAPDPSLSDGSEHWESTGQVEYRLADGRRVEARKDGSLRIAGAGIALTSPQPH
jgi:hypothetical protein